MALPLIDQVRGEREYHDVPLDLVHPNPLNPRQRFEPDALAELVESVKAHGILEPLLVTPFEDEFGSELYSVVCGERRRQAAVKAGLTWVPAIVREMDETTQLQVMLTENIIRADLDPVEEARGLQRLLDEFGMTQAELGQQLGKSQPWISNRLRLLRLPETVLAKVQTGEISAGHAQVLLQYERAPEVIEKAAARIVKNSTPVGNTQSAVRAVLSEDKATRPLRGGGYVGNRWVQVIFDAKTCGDCPDILKTDGDPVCHNPECWDRKQVEAQQAANEAAKSKLRDGQTVTLAAIEKSGAEHVGPWEFKDFPECMGCEHRKSVLDSGDRIKVICLDPKCHRRKVVAAGKAAKLEVRQQIKSAFDQAAAAAGTAAPSLEHNHLVFLLCALLLRADGGTYLTQDVKWPTNTEFAKSVLGIDGWPRRMHFHASYQEAEQAATLKQLLAQVASLPDDKLRAALVHWTLLAWSPKALGPLVELVGFGKDKPAESAAAGEEDPAFDDGADDYCPAPDRCEWWGGVEGCQNPDGDCPFDSDEEASPQA